VSTKKAKREADNPEFESFDRTMRRLMSVPHSEIKAKLQAEKAAKKSKTKKASALDDHERGEKG
jgi:hypothetical protein